MDNHQRDSPETDSAVPTCPPAERRAQRKVKDGAANAAAPAKAGRLPGRGLLLTRHWSKPDSNSQSRRRDRSRSGRLGSARFALLARRAIPSSQVGQLEWLHPAPQLGQQLLGLPVSKFVNDPTLRPGIEHFQAATI